MEDWLDTPNVRAYGLENCHRLDSLHTLRVEDPVLWAMVTRCRASRRIAARIAWPHEDVLLKLRDYKAQGLVYDIEGRFGIEWHFAEDETDMLQLHAWFVTQQNKGGLFNPNEQRQE